MQSFACFFFDFPGRPSAQLGFGLDVTGTGIYSNASAWCNHILPQHILPGNSTIGLIDNIFLICGNKAWKGIPGKAVGGPCTFGRLTPFHTVQHNLTALHSLV